MVNQETKNDYAIVGMVIALITGILATVFLVSEISVMPQKIVDLIVNNTTTNNTNGTGSDNNIPIIVLPLNNTVVIDNNITNHTTVQNNTSTDANTQTDIVVVINNQTQTANSTKPLPEPVKDYFTTVCNIAPSADVCIGPKS